MLESWTTISVLAGVTSKIKLGTMMTGIKLGNNHSSNSSALNRMTMLGNNFQAKAILQIFLIMQKT